MTFCDNTHYVKGQDEAGIDCLYQPFVPVIIPHSDCFPSAFSFLLNSYTLCLSGISLLASCSWWAVRLWRWKMWFFWSLVWENTSLLQSWATLSMEASSCPSSTSASHARTPTVSCQASSRPSPLPSPPAPGILSHHRVPDQQLTTLKWEKGFACQ